MDKFKNKLVSSTGWKILATIMCFIYILNVFPTWFGTEKLTNDTILRIIITIIGVIFWIPGLILGLKFVWIDN